MGAPYAALDARPLPRPAGALRDGRRRRAARRSRPPRARSPTCGSGRLDEETTANVGTIKGGSARNIVPEWCELEAEARSHDARKLADLVQEMLDTFAFAASVAECTLETEVSETYPGLPLQGATIRSCSSRGRRSSAAATSSCPRSPAAAPTRTSSTRAGCPCLNLANGMAEIHTADEHIAVADLERDGRRHARARRCRSGLDAGVVTAVGRGGDERLVRLEVDGDRRASPTRG